MPTGGIYLVTDAQRPVANVEVEIRQEHAHFAFCLFLLIFSPKGRCPASP
jgi:hypothetical protein